jgi:two-component sensor histidine kinase
LMLRQNWQGAWLDDLVRAHLDLFGAIPRARLEGPPLFLNADAVQNVGFALHELATNAAKYGALASPEGVLRISWSAANGRVHLDWKELPSAPVQPPTRHGFGYLVVSQLVPHAMQGNAKLDFEPDGLLWHVDFPESFVLSESPQNKTSKL